MTQPSPTAVRQLAETAKPYSLALLWWGLERHMEEGGASAIERNTNVEWCRCALTGVTVLCPVSSETLAGVAIMNLPSDGQERWTGIHACGPG